MKTLFLIVLLSVGCLNVVYSQDSKPGPTDDETKEAQELAAKFFNRYSETQDVSPLIDEFFIKDFGTRLSFCWSTNECGGFGRDFWGNEGELVQLGAEDSDFLHAYVFAINYFHLFFQIMDHVKFLKPDNSDELEENTVIEIKKRLIDKKELLKYGMFLNDEEEENDSNQITDLTGYRAELEKAEELISEMRKVESQLRIETEKENPNGNWRFSPTDFDLQMIENDGLFFKYPIGTRLFDVWIDIDGEHKIPFKMDLIRENGSLKVVAIYPPID